MTEKQVDDSFYNEDGRLIKCPYQLSENQKAFVRDARAAGHQVYFSYSGRGMYGRSCPAVDVDRGEYLNMATKAKYTHDSMGLGTVYYAPF